MKPAPFTYHAPDTLDAAVGLLADLDEAKVLAGGQSLVPLLNMRLALAAHVVDLRRIDGLAGVERRDGSLRIGASTTQADLEHSAAVAASVPLLARALPHIGHFQIRNRGTIGGSLAHADPAAELPAVALALDATIEAASAQGRRSIPAASFFTGIFTTALRDEEVLTAIELPIWEGRCGFAVEEVARRHGDFAIAGACVGLELDSDDVVKRCTIGLFGLGSTPERARGAETYVASSALDAIDGTEVGRRAVADLGAIPADLNGSADYRARVGATVVTRAWRRATEEARHV